MSTLSKAPAVLITIAVALSAIYMILVRTELICTIIWCRPLAPIELSSPIPGTKVCDNHPLTGSVKTGVQPVIIINIGAGSVWVQNAVEINDPNWSTKWWDFTMIGRKMWSLYANFGEGRKGLGQHYTVLGFIEPVSPKDGKPIEPKTLLDKDKKNIGQEPKDHGGRFPLGIFERKDC